MPSKNLGQTVTIIGLDPGSTTGVCGVSIAKHWLRGGGEANWTGLGAALRAKFAYQVGREPKVFAYDAEIEREHSYRLDQHELNERMLPVMASQPLVQQDGMRSTARLERILAGEGPGGNLLFVDAEEIVQVRQIAGLLYNYEEAAVVCEDFTLRTQVRSREVTAPDRLRAALQTNEVLHGEGRVFFLQQASMAKSTATDERLKRAGLYFPGMQHATDAARHVLTFLRRARQAEDLRVGAWPKHFTDDFGDE